MSQADNLAALGSNVNSSGVLQPASGGTGATSTAAAPFATKGANSDITSLSGLTTPLSAAQGGTGLTSFPSPGTTGNVLTSNGSAWTSAAAAAFDAGTRMLFAQTSAPTGWTKDTTNYNNFALRVVTGTASTGGSVAFTTAFASQTPTISNTLSVNTSGLSAGATTLTTAQIPSHSHTLPTNWGNLDAGGVNGAGNNASPSSGSTGGGGSHSHSISGSATLSGGITSSAINLAVQYLDVITATKN